MKHGLVMASRGEGTGSVQWVMFIHLLKICRRSSKHSTELLQEKDKKGGHEENSDLPFLTDVHLLKEKLIIILAKLCKIKFVF